MANTLAVRKPPTRQLPAPAAAMWFLLSAPLPPSDPGLSQVSSQRPCPTPSSPCMPSRSPSTPPSIPSTSISQTSIPDPCLSPSVCFDLGGVLATTSHTSEPAGRVTGKESRAVRRLERGTLCLASVCPGAPGLLPPAVPLLQRKIGSHQQEATLVNLSQ